MNRTVKGMVAVGISASVIWGGYTYNDLNNELESATKAVNRLEQKVEDSNEKINMLSEENKSLGDSYKILEEDYSKTLNSNEELDSKNKELNKEIKNLNKYIEDLNSNYINVSASAYIATCKEGCTGNTATGLNVKNTLYYEGRRVIATDPNVIPMYTEVDLHFKDGSVVKAVAMDTGGAIKGNKIDYLVGSTSEAVKFGRQDVTVKITKRG